MVHQNTFGRWTPPGPTGGDNVLPIPYIAAMKGPTFKGDGRRKRGKGTEREEKGWEERHVKAGMLLTQKHHTVLSNR